MYSLNRIVGIHGLLTQTHCLQTQRTWRKHRAHMEQVRLSAAFPELQIKPRGIMLGWEGRKRPKLSL